MVARNVEMASRWEATPPPPVAVEVQKDRPSTDLAAWAEVAAAVKASRGRKEGLYQGRLAFSARRSDALWRAVAELGGWDVVVEAVEAGSMPPKWSEVWIDELVAA